MKLVTVVGARPQFVKMAPVSRALKSRAVREIVVHTGQHYDDAMSGSFFRELGLAAPDVNLNVGSGGHGAQTGEMLARLEPVLLRERPDALMVYGDTNSTLAGALCAAKLHVPVAHVEAGLRSFNRRMPEELNRVLTDHLAALLLCPTETAVRNLAREGIVSGVHLSGDVMHDALFMHLATAERASDVLRRLGLSAGGYLLATIHRAENTDDPARFAALLGALGDLAAGGVPVVFPAHPRTRKKLAEAGAQSGPGVRIVDPVPYLDMLVLERGARTILTDSGGVQKEACWLKVPCVTLRDETEWPETVAAGWNRLAGADRARVVAAARSAVPPTGPAAAAEQAGGAADRVAALVASLG